MLPSLLYLFYEFVSPARASPKKTVNVTEVKILKYVLLKGLKFPQGIGLAALACTEIIPVHGKTLKTI